jgi:hypothetical protein
MLTRSANIKLPHVRQDIITECVSNKAIHINTRSKQNRIEFEHFDHFPSSSGDLR